MKPLFPPPRNPDKQTPKHSALLCQLSFFLVLLCLYIALTRIFFKIQVPVLVNRTVFVPHDFDLLKVCSVLSFPAKGPVVTHPTFGAPRTRSGYSPRSFSQLQSRKTSSDKVVSHGVSEIHRLLLVAKRFNLQSHREKIHTYRKDHMNFDLQVKPCLCTKFKGEKYKSLKQRMSFGVIMWSWASQAAQYSPL